jgi:regulatory protein
MKMLSHRRRGKIPTRQSLENTALSYLSRYAASEFSLRHVLENRLRQTALLNPLFAEDGALQKQLRMVIDGIVEKHKKTGVLNDAAYAEMKTSSLRRAGRSARAIRQRLGQKGIAPALVTKALGRGADQGDPAEAEFKAALALARRRRLGPFRKNKAAPEQERKDLATLARAGFSFDIARRVLGETIRDVAGDEMFFDSD